MFEALLPFFLITLFLKKSVHRLIFGIPTAGSPAMWKRVNWSFCHNDSKNALSPIVQDSPTLIFSCHQVTPGVIQTRIDRLQDH